MEKIGPEQEFSYCRFMSTDTDLLPAELQRLLQLFSSLPDVRFPDFDAASLQDDVARVKDRSIETQYIEAQLNAAKLALEDEGEALLKKGHRLLGYLRIYAEADETLREKVSAISLPKLRRAVPAVTLEQGLVLNAEAPKKRGRPRKGPTSDALFAEAAGEAAAAV
jgi:hypothetical protein